jgi:hypothetical protein
VREGVREREKEGGRERKREGERERERKREVERERDVELSRIVIFIFLGMMGALAPFSYLIQYS